MVHGNLGLAALLGGRHEQAQTEFRAQLVICANAVLPSMAAEGLAGMAALAAARGRADVAARLSGAAEQLGFRATGAEANVDRRLIRQFLEPARAATPQADWERHQAEGERMDLRAAVGYGLEPRDRLWNATASVACISGPPCRTLGDLEPRPPARPSAGACR